MEKNNAKKKERHRTIRRKRKERIAYFEMLYTFLERNHPYMLEEFQKFCCGHQPHINLDQPQPTPEPAPENTPDGSIDCIKDDSSAGAGAGTLPQQDANLQLPPTDDLLQVERYIMERLAVGVKRFR